MKHLKLYHINSYKNLLESEAATKVFCNKTLLKNFCKSHKETPVPESLFK